MQIKAASPDGYVSLLPADRQEPIQKLRNVIKKNLPKGFKRRNVIWYDWLCCAT